MTCVCVCVGKVDIINKNNNLTFLMRILNPGVKLNVLKSETLIFIPSCGMLPVQHHSELTRSSCFSLSHDYNCWPPKLACVQTVIDNM